MYADYIPGYSKLTRNQKKKARKAYKKRFGVSTLNELTSYEFKLFRPIEFVSLDTLTVSNDNNNAQECNMCYETKQPDAAKDYILLHLSDLRYTKRQELEKQFGLYGLSPSSFKELKEWLKSGNYRINDEPEDFDEDEDGFYWQDAFRWGKDKPDHKAYKAAQKKLEEKYQEVLDLVSILTDEEKRLEALRNFRSATFH